MKKVLCLIVAFVLLLVSCGKNNEFEKFDIYIETLEDGTLQIEYDIDVKFNKLSEEHYYIDLYLVDNHNGIYSDFVIFTDICTNITFEEKNINEKPARYIRCDLINDIKDGELININFTYKLSELYIYHDFSTEIDSVLIYYYYVPEDCKNLYWVSGKEKDSFGGVFDSGQLHWNLEEQYFSFVKMTYTASDYSNINKYRTKFVEPSAYDKDNHFKMQGETFVILFNVFFMIILIFPIILFICIKLRRKINEKSRMKRSDRRISHNIRVMTGSKKVDEDDE